jgi:hypothetical protein
MSEAVAFAATTRLPVSKRRHRPRRASVILFLCSSAFLLLALPLRPLQAQSRGEVQVTAQVLPAQPGYQALAAARAPTTTPTNTLFRVSWARRTETPGAAAAEKNDVIVTVEFLAN